MDMIRKQFVASEIAKGDDGVATRVRRFVISTGGVDRDNDTIDPAGWKLDNYRRNPVVLWAHDYSQLPLGKALSVDMLDGNLVASAEFADHPMADTVLRLIDGGFLRATSVGFRPTKRVDNVERGGYDYKEQELLEFSVVPVPSNPQALVAAGLDADLAVLKGWADGVLKLVAEAPVEHHEDPVRWNRSLSKAFDVDGEPLQAHNLEYTWVSRFLDTPVKDLYETTLHVGGARVGSFLTALDEGLAGYATASVRNFNHHGEKEVPPVYETMQLNSKLTRSFLVEGLRFLSGPMKMVVKVQPSWAGVAVTSYIARGGADSLVEFLAQCGARASGYKFLKGEAFSVSGEFLERDGTTWDDLFLAPVNLDPIQRTVKLLNEQALGMESRGLILMGPPGTGKTLAARVMMNQAKDATFVWVSNRDLSRMGSFGGLTQAFDLAAENAPAVVLLEDVDSEIVYHTDLLKTELDGLKRKGGIVTVLTTNFPEQLPKALIDRPGRFHDVLQLDLPTETIRRAMLASWAPDAAAAVLDQLAKDTFGMSGAHLRELVRFANVIRSQDGVAIDHALPRAFDKVKEQREIIDAARQPKLRAVKSFAADSAVDVIETTQPGDSNRTYAPGKRRDVAIFGQKHGHGGGSGTCSRCGTAGELAAGVCGKCVNEIHPWGHDALLAVVAGIVRGVVDQPVAKAGRVLSKANEDSIRSAKDLLESVLRQLEAAAPVEDEDGKAPKPVTCEHGQNADACELCAKAPTAPCEHGMDPADCDACRAAAAGKAVALEIDDIAVDEVVLDMADDGDVVEVDPEQLRDAMADVMREALRGVVRDAAASTVAKMRGRVD